MTWFSPSQSCKPRSLFIFSLRGLYFETTVPGLETSHVVFSFSHDLGQSFRKILTGTVLAQDLAWFSLYLELQFHMTWYSPRKIGTVLRGDRGKGEEPWGTPDCPPGLTCA